MSNLLKLPYFRMVSGVKTPYIMVLDAARVLVDDYVDSKALEGVLRDLKTPVVLDPKSARKLEILTAWFDENSTNPIAGTDNIRASCLNKMREAESASCTPCELNSIKMEYRAILENAKLI